MLLFLYIATGFVLGSFLNVVIYRSPRAELLTSPWSSCPHCQARLLWCDLIPVLSYLLLRGCCRFCGARISWRYPLVELLSAAGFAIAYLRYGSSIWMLAVCVFFSVLIVSTFTDLETGLIPDRITYTGIITGFLLSFFTVGWQSSLAGLLLFAALLFLTGFLSGGGMGGGDVKLGAAIGAFLGVKMGLLAFVLAALLGGAWALSLLALGRASLKTRIKYGPFLAVAAVSVWAFGQNIIDFYLQLLKF